MTTLTDRAARPGAGRALLAAAVVAALLVAVLAVLAGDGGDEAMSAGQATAFVEEALADADVEATVGEPTAGTFRSGGALEDVWVVPARVGDQEIAVSVDADGDKALNLADQLADGSNVLSEEQFLALARYRDDPTDEDTTLPSVVALLAALGTGLAVASAIRSRRAPVPAL